MLTKSVWCECWQGSARTPFGDSLGLLIGWEKIPPSYWLSCILSIFWLAPLTTSWPIRTRCVCSRPITILGLQYADNILDLDRYRVRFTDVSETFRVYLELKGTEHRPVFLHLVGKYLMLLARGHGHGVSVGAQKMSEKGIWCRQSMQSICLWLIMESIYRNGQTNKRSVMCGHAIFLFKTRADWLVWTFFWCLNKQVSPQYRNKLSIAPSCHISHYLPIRTRHVCEKISEILGHDRICNIHKSNGIFLIYFLGDPPHDQPVTSSRSLCYAGGMHRVEALSLATRGRHASCWGSITSVHTPHDIQGDDGGFRLVTRGVLQGQNRELCDDKLRVFRMNE